MRVSVILAGHFLNTNFPKRPLAFLQGPLAYILLKQNVALFIVMPPTCKFKLLSMGTNLIFDLISSMPYSAAVPNGLTERSRSVTHIVCPLSMVQEF